MNHNPDTFRSLPPEAYENIIKDLEMQLAKANEKTSTKGTFGKSLQKVLDNLKNFATINYAIATMTIILVLVILASTMLYGSGVIIVAGFATIIMCLFWCLYLVAANRLEC